jgi:hypothetical protein
MSPPRKFSGEIKPGMGTDAIEGENFTKRSQDPWSPPKMGREYSQPGAYTNNDSGLRDTGTDPENYSEIDIFDRVESQSDRTGPVVLRKRDR